MKASEFDKHPELGESFWGQDPVWAIYDWEQEVLKGDTRLGYWDWVIAQRKASETTTESVPTYDHVYTIAFSVPGSLSPTGEDVTDQQLLTALHKRLQQLNNSSGEILEACGMPDASSLEL